VQYRDGQFFLEDLSTNGIFLNDEELPVSKRFPGGYRMQNWDIVRIGQYQIVVAVEAAEAAAAPAPADGAAVPTSIHALHSLGRAAQTDIGAMLNLDDLLVPDSSPSDNFRPVDAYGVPVRTAAPIPSPAAARRGAAPAVAQTVAAEPASATDIDIESEAVARRIARLARAAGRDPRNGASAPALYDVHSGLQAFCRGAGMDGDKLSPDAQTRMLHVAGQLFREALVGFKELERARHEVRNRFRIEIQPEPDDPRPSLARLTVDELMLELLQQHETRRLDAVQWLREAVAEAKTHENASSAAMRAAFIEFLDRLDPSELEARFERAARRGKAKSADKAQYWDLFTTFYRNLIEMPADHLPHTFIEAFATAYRDFFKQIPPQR
jgi:type VI secretion system protein